MVTSSTSLDGGGKVTLSGANINRVLSVDAGIFGPALAFTLTHITRTNGYAGPGNGGCLGAGFAARIVLDDVTVQNCRTDSAGFGGGIDSGLANQLLVLGSRVLNNEAGEGGGIRGIGIITVSQTLVAYNHAITGGALALPAVVATIADSTFYSNTAAGDGGAIHNAGTITAKGTTFSANQAQNGGGIYNEGTATLDHATLSGNTAGSNGGGLFNNRAATLSNATLSGNTATYGGGIENLFVATLSNSTLSGKTAALDGGGILNNGQTTLRYATMSNNAATQGGALYMQSGHSTVLTNTILAYSPGGGSCFGTLTASKFTFSSDNSCALPPGNTIKGQNPNGLDPLLTALGNYGGPALVHMPKTASPAIAGIVGSDAPLTDQRGQPRPGPDGSYDIGAVERQPGDSDLAPRLYLPLIRR